MQLGFLIMLIIIYIPPLLTLLNVLFLIFDKKVNDRAKNTLDATIFLLGIPLTALLVLILDFHEWSTPIYPEQNYTPISFESLPTFTTLAVLAMVAYLLPRIFHAKLPPLTAAICYAGMFIGMMLITALAVQAALRITDQEIIYLLLLPLNYVLCSVRVIRATAQQYCDKLKGTEYSQPLLILCKKLLSSCVKFVLFSFLLALPLLILVIIILLLFGQKPDSVITGFTNTAEWTLSQKIPPPRLDYDGHYLCTVAACGDEKTVKPLRAGRRRGRLIIVNRQLLVANAFEELISERTPRFHKFIRNLYDHIGLPISKHINTKHRSNAVYYIMKPFEWLFLAVLYTFDSDPENRIAVQYTK